uniref:Uncharacterized protein n=1 Tax=Arundo donax TaxID=35708 RepID=A0A0A8XZP2_ARUDO
MTTMYGVGVHSHVRVVLHTLARIDFRKTNKCVNL